MSEDEPAAKRAAVSTTTTATSSEAPPALPETEEEGKLRLLLARLQQAVQDDRKRLKACGILLKALQTDLDAAHAPLFVPVVEALAAAGLSSTANAKTLAAPTAAQREALLALRAVFHELYGRLQLFADSQFRFRVHTCYLQSVVHYDLHTDDSFQFAAAAKKLEAATVELDAILQRHKQQEEDGMPIVDTSKRAAVSEADKRQRCGCLLDILSSMQLMGRRPWARPTVEHIVKLFTDRRLIIPEGELRDRLDSTLDAWRNRQTADSLGVKRSANKPYANFST